MTTTPSWLRRAQSRSTEHSWALGSVLDQYCRIEALTGDQLAALLGCSVDSLAWLALCRKPSPEHFMDDVTKVAERFHIDGAKLAGIIRRVDVVTVLRRAVDVEDVSSLLLAARDRGQKDTTK